MNIVEKIQAYFSSKKSLLKELHEAYERCHMLEEECKRWHEDARHYQDRYSTCFQKLQALELANQEKCRHAINYNPDDRTYHCFKCFQKFEDAK